METITIYTDPPRPRFPGPDDYREVDRARARQQVDEVLAERAARRRTETRAALACTRCGAAGFVINGYRCDSCGHSSRT